MPEKIRFPFEEAEARIKILSVIGGLYISRIIKVPHQDCERKPYIITRALDTLARLFEITSNCCAISVKYCNILNKIIQINIAFNSKTPSEAHKKLIGEIRKVLEYPTNNTYKKHLIEMNAKKRLYSKEAIEDLIKQLHTYIQEFNESIGETGESSIVKFDMPDTTLDSFDKLLYVTNFLERSNPLKEFIKSSPSLKFLKPFYLHARAFVDWIKFITLVLPKIDTSKPDELIKIIPNEDGIHAEMAILTENPTLDHYIGVSKLCCHLCYKVFEILEKQHNVRGAHELLYADDWKMPKGLMDKDMLEKFLNELKALLPEKNLRDLVDPRVDFSSDSVGNTYIDEFSDDEGEPAEVITVKKIYRELNEKTPSTSKTDDRSSTSFSALDSSGPSHEDKVPLPAEVLAAKRGVAPGGEDTSDAGAGSEREVGGEYLL